MTGCVQSMGRNATHLVSTSEACSFVSLGDIDLGRLNVWLLLSCIFCKKGVLCVCGRAIVFLFVTVCFGL